MCHKALYSTTRVIALPGTYVTMGSMSANELSCVFLACSSGIEWGRELAWPRGAEDQLALAFPVFPLDMEGYLAFAPFQGSYPMCRMGGQFLPCYGYSGVTKCRLVCCSARQFLFFPFGFAFIWRYTPILYHTRSWTNWVHTANFTGPLISTNNNKNN